MPTRGSKTEAKTNIFISCIYRTPGSSIDIFSNWIGDSLTKISHKNVFFCGDFNIDLLNPNNHKKTDFINTLYSLSMHPTITRPSRATSHCATLIDNIFTNVMDTNLTSGLLINDITDHLPVFIIYDCDVYDNFHDNCLQYRRVRTEDSMNSLVNDLIEYKWESVYNERDVDVAYDKFLRIFKLLYDRNCPMRRVNNTHKYKNNPWITKGLQNACKKKKKRTHYTDISWHTELLKLKVNIRSIKTS